MSKKIIDIKKPEKKHVDVISVQTPEAHIVVHEDSVQHTVQKTKDTEIAQNNKFKATSSQKQDSQSDATTNLSHITEKKVLSKESNEKFRVIFMGTGHFAGSILNELCAKDECVITEIVTQPDKKIGRKKSSIHRTLAPNPVRDIAIAHNFSLYQPLKIDVDVIAHIKALTPHVIVVASYGKILPNELLTIPKIGSINVHASLLPKLRGASPAQNALMLGLTETGVTIMQMDEGLDTGAILAQKKVTIEAHEKSDELLDRLSKIGAKLLIGIVPQLIRGEITPVPQDPSNATLCQLIDREDGHIQWTQTTQEIYNRYRALYPWPGIFSYWEETQNQMIRIKFRAINPYLDDLTEEQKTLQPGTVFIGHDQLCIKTFDTAIIIESVQPECKIIMPVYDFLNGHKTFEGAILR